MHLRGWGRRLIETEREEAPRIIAIILVKGILVKMQKVVVEVKNFARSRSKTHPLPYELIAVQCNRLQTKCPFRSAHGEKFK
jgi:hypothetical protein